MGRASVILQISVKVGEPPDSGLLVRSALWVAGAVSHGDDAPGPRLSRESRAVFDLALCAHISNDNRLSSKAEEILEGWADTTKRIGTLQGQDDFSFDFPYALFGAHLLELDENWHSADFTKFVRDIVVPANNSDKPNNHGNWVFLCSQVPADT